MMLDGGMGSFGWIFMTAFWVLVIAGVVWLVRTAGRPSEDGRGSARRILDERFANGDLSVEEYEQRRRALR
jgi:putative membrane protein